MTVATDKTAAGVATPHTATRVSRVTARGQHVVRQAVHRYADAALRVLILIAERPTMALAVSMVYVFSPIGSVRTLAIVAASGIFAIISSPPALRQLAPSLVGATKFRKRRNRIRRRWTVAMTDAGLSKTRKRHPDKPRVPRLIHLRKTAIGVRVTADGSPVGAGLDQFAVATARLVTAFGAREAVCSSTPKIHRRLWSGPQELCVQLDLIYDDAFARVVLPEALPPAVKPLHVVVGTDAYGEPVEKDLRLPHLLVGGQGSGKSSEAWRILQALVSCKIPFRLWVFDPKGGQEFHLLRDVAYVYESNPAHWARFMELALGALSVQQSILAGQGKFESDFTRDNPLNVVLIDELVTAVAISDGRTKIKFSGKDIGLDKALTVYASQCRSAGGTLIALSQLPQKEILGASRDLFGYVSCGRVASDDMVRALGLDPAVHPAHLLPAGEETAGVMFTTLPTGGVVKYRGAWVSHAERTRVADAIGATQAYYRAMTGRGDNRATP